MDWIDLAHDRDQWRALVNLVMNLWVLYNLGKCLSSCTSGNSVGWAELHEVSQLWFWRGQDSAAGIASVYALPSWEVRVWALVATGFSPLHVLHTSSETHPASYPMGTGGRGRGRNNGGTWSWVKSTGIY
jgi:hypothetical protein